MIHGTKHVDYKAILAARLTRKPLWATRQFQLLIAVMVLSLGGIAVYLFEIKPATERQRKLPAEAVAPKVSPDEMKREAAMVRFDGVLEKAKDLTPLPDNRKEFIDYFDEPYRYLVRYMNSVTSDALSKQGKKIDYKLYGQKAAEVRGLTAKIVGLYIDVRHLRLDKPVGDLEFIHRVTLLDLSGDEGYVVDLIEPPQMTLRETVYLDAVFLKMAPYEGNKGVMQVPFFIGRGMKPLLKDDVAPGGIPASLMVGIIAGGALIIVAVLTIQIWLSNRPRKPDNMA